MNAVNLVVEHAAVRRGSVRVLEAGRIAAPAPGAVAIVGINGSGKSSLFMQLADVLLVRGSASVRVGDRAASLAWVPQEPAFPSWLAVSDVVRAYCLEPDTLIDAMPGLHLGEFWRRSAGTLSVGQRQTLAIALALGRAADVTLLDEPFAALDFRRRIAAIDLLQAHRGSGRSFLLSSQAAPDLVDLCDSFVVIRDGRYVFNGQRSDLAAMSAGGIARRLLQLLS